MEAVESRWEQLGCRLRQLEYSDQEEEAEGLEEAYENLMGAYQEARALNDEMEDLLREIIAEGDHIIL